LTAILSLTGGATNPFSLLYLVQITLSALVLSKFWTWILGALSTIGFGLLFFIRLPAATAASHHIEEEGFSPHLVGMWIAFVIAAGLITFFTGKISDALRKRDRDVLTLQEQVAKSERLASLVTLAAGAAHELGTPLGTIAIVAGELEHYAGNIARNDAVLVDSRLIRSEVERCRRILERMSAQSAEPVGETPVSIRLSDLLEEVRAQFPEFRRPALRVEVLDSDVAAVLPERATVQSLVALVQNAFDASPEGQGVVISAGTSNTVLRICVKDEGDGMPPSVLRRIGEPFFTTKEPGKGMGLGTFLVRTFAESMGGRMLFDSIPQVGTTATLELPMTSSEKEHVTH
jgi:two-component system sensor histidine kinase RegB